MSPPKNSDKLADAFKEYLPPGSRFMFLLVEKSGKGAWVSSMTSIINLEARVEILEHALADARKHLEESPTPDPDAPDRQSRGDKKENGSR